MVYDTKAMATSLGLFTKTDLHYMSQQMSQSKKFRSYIDFEYDVSHGFTKYMNKQMLHEAGYDSYLTGVIFGTIVKYMEASHYISNIRQKEELTQKVLNQKLIQPGDDPSTIMALLGQLQMGDKGITAAQAAAA